VINTEEKIPVRNVLTIFNSGLENKKHEFGWRFYVKGEFLKYVKKTLKL
jgi:hypothetical protein